MRFDRKAWVTESKNSNFGAKLKIRVNALDVFGMVYSIYPWSFREKALGLTVLWRLKQGNLLLNHPVLNISKWNLVGRLSGPRRTHSSHLKIFVFPPKFKFFHRQARIPRSKHVKWDVHLLNCVRRGPCISLIKIAKFSLVCVSLTGAHLILHVSIEEYGPVDEKFEFWRENKNFLNAMNVFPVAQRVYLPSFTY